MPMKFKDAVRKMSDDPNLKLFFFFCEKGEDGKPVMLVDTKKLDPKKAGPAKEALDSAQNKGNSIGTMRLREKLLNLKPEGTGLSATKLSTGVKLAANHAGVQALIQDVNVGTPAPEEDEKKVHADPLRADPAIAKLLDEQKELKAKIEELVGDGPSTDLIKDKDKRKEVQKLQVELEALNGKLEGAQKDFNARGFSPQALRPEYQDEDKKFGWRTDNADPLPRSDFASDSDYEDYQKKREQLRESDRRVTKRFNEQEQQDSEVKFDEQGRAVGKRIKNPDGTMSGEREVMYGDKFDYVMDESGKMKQFQQKGVKTGEQMVQPVTGEVVDKDVYSHHSSPVDGKAVAGAGEAEVDYQGYLKKISNKSGHYKPGATQVIQLLEELARQGALLDKTYLMPGPDGTGVALTGKPKEIFDAVAKVEAGVKKKLEEGKDVESDLAAIKQAKAALAKLGAAPGNKFRDVEVEFLDGADKKKGAEVRQGKGDVSTAKDFLKTGGGNQKQSTAKGGMLDELKKKYAEKAAKLDEEAEKLAQRVSGALKEKVAKLPAVLDWYQGQMEKALQDQSPRGKALQKMLTEGIVRIQKALKPTDTSDEALGQILEDLEKHLAKDKKKVQPIPITKGMSMTLDEDLAERVGKPLTTLESWVDEDGILEADVLAKKLSISFAELEKLLQGDKKPPIPITKGTSMTLDEDLAERVGVSVSTLESWVDEDGILEADILAKKLSISFAELEKLLG